MLNKTEEPSTLRLIVVFLRFHARMTQTELGKAASVEQAVSESLAEYGPGARLAVIPKGPYVLPYVVGA